MTDPALPPPLTPDDADLRDFKFMPLHVARFAKSGLVTLEEPAAVLAAVLLWGASWHEVPAGSLVDDDKQLAQLAGYGRAVDAFRLVKAGALRGWVKCSDGRLYHPVVAEMVKDSWLGKLKQRWRTYCGAIRQHNGRNPHDQRDSPGFEDWLESGRPTTVVRGRAVPQQPAFDLDEDDSRAGTRTGALRARVSGSGDEDERVTRDNGDESRVTGAGVTLENGECSQENGSKGQRQGQGQGDSDSPPNPPPDLMALTQRLASAGGVSIVTPTRIARAMDIVKGWVRDGVDVEGIILPCIAKRLESMPGGETVGSLSYFDPDIRKAHALAKRRGSSSPSPPGKPPRPLKEPDDDDERIERIRFRLKRDCGSRTYDGWLAPGHTALHVNGTGLVVHARAGFMADWLAQHFADRFKAEAKAEGLADARIVEVK